MLRRGLFIYYGWFHIKFIQMSKKQEQNWKRPQPDGWMETCPLCCPAYWAPSLDNWYFKACVTTALLPVDACFSHLVMDRAASYIVSFPSCLAWCPVTSPCSHWSNVLHQAQTIRTFIFPLSFTGVVSTIYKRLPSVLTSTCYTSESCCTSLIVEQRVGTPPLVGCTLIGATCSWSIILITRSKGVKMCQVFWSCTWMLLAFDPPVQPHRCNLLKLNMDSLPSLCLFDS